MPGTKVGSWDIVPFRIIADFSEAPKEVVQSPSAKLRGVFCDDERGLGFVDKSEHIEPKHRAFSVESFGIGVCNANVLTWKAPGDDVGGVELFSGDGADVAVDLSGRPVTGEDLLVPFVYLGKSDRRDAGAVEPESGPANPREEVCGPYDLAPVTRTPRSKVA